MNNGPVGVFDSGLGGISVLRKITEIMPDEDYIFYGDSLNAPYGTKSDEEVWELTHHVFRLLLDRGVKSMVIACNTATSVAVRRLRNMYPDFPLVGMEPAIKPAAEKYRGGRVVVMATPVTLRRDKFRRLMGRFTDMAEVVPLPAPEIVSYVEAGKIHDPGLVKYIRGLFESIDDGRKADAVVLGCTHFPFVADIIQEAAGPQAELFDGSAGTARELRRRMKEADMMAASGKKEHSIQIMNSADEEHVRFSWKLFRGEI